MKILPGRAEFFQGKGTNSTTLGPILCENVRLPKMLVKFDKSLSFPCGLSQKMISCFSNLRLNHSAGYPTFFLRTIQPCVACIWRMVSCLNIRSDMCQLMVVSLPSQTCPVSCCGLSSIPTCMSISASLYVDLNEWNLDIWQYIFGVTHKLWEQWVRVNIDEKKIWISALKTLHPK